MEKKNREFQVYQAAGELRDSVGEQEQDGQEQKERDRQVEDYGQLTLDDGEIRIHLLNIIGEIEGHECLPSNSKTTKYEHVIPQLAALEDSRRVQGLLVLINTVGGDVESGLAIAEMIASLSKPTVSLVLGGSHSIGVPLAVSTDYSLIVPTGTMMIHPVRMNGLIIGVAQTFEYFQKIQDRITGFIAEHSRVPQDKIEEMMMNTKDLTKDLGTLLVGEDTVKIGLIHHVGGIDRALKRLHEMIGERKKGSA